MEKKSSLTQVVVQLIVAGLCIAGIGLGGLGWYFEDNYGNWQGPYPIVERVDLPEGYRTDRWGDVCNFYGPSSLVFLGIEDDQVLWEYQNPAERRNPWRECARGRNFKTLSDWNHFSTHIRDQIADWEETRRAAAAEEERVRQARERLNQSAGQGS